MGLRDEFEKWAHANGRDTSKWSHDPDSYVWFETGLAWEAWQGASIAAEARKSAAVRDALAERRRQIEDEGWTPEHDDEHTNFALARAGACYAEFGNWPAHGCIAPSTWPWPAERWKPTDYRRNIVKAAALILAEIERLDRLQTQKGEK